MRHIWVAVVVAGSCAGNPDPELEESQVALQAIMSNAIMSNAIMSNALTGNRDASEMLIAGPLRDETFLNNPFLAEQLEDPLARTVLKYIWGCSMGLNDYLTVSGSFGTEVYKGGGGMCTKWKSGPPDRQCQEQVSACLMARNNACGHSHQLSLRGENTDPTVFAGPLPEVPPNGTYLPAACPAPGPPKQVKSLIACPPGKLGYLEDCGWSLDRIGNCTPGTTAIVSTKAYGGWSSGGSALRIIAGVRADDNAQALTVTRNSAPGLPDEVKFTCPSSGLFSVMKAPYKRDVSVTMVTGGSVVGGRFPAPEGWMSGDYAVFPWPEGHFFGNIFGKANFAGSFVNNVCDPKTHVCYHPPSNNTNLDPAFKNAFACTSEVWTDGAATARDRLCAAGQRWEGCFATYVGQCVDVCRLRDGTQRIGDYNFQDCKAPTGTRYTTGISTFLNNPCDLTPGHCLTSCGPDIALCI
jgi:hypothetical protein